MSFSGRWPVKQQRWRRFSCSVGSGFSSPGRETGYVDFNREKGRRQGKKPNTVESIDGVIERDDIDEIVWEVQV